VTILQKLAYPAKYLRMYWIDLHQIFIVARAMGGDYKTDILFAVARGALLWQPVKFWEQINVHDWHHLHSLQWRSITNWNMAKPMLALTAAMIPQHRVKIWLVNFWSVTSEFMRLDCVQQTSISSSTRTSLISTRVSLTAFGRGRHCYALWRSVLNSVSLLFARGRHRFAERATR